MAVDKLLRILILEGAIDNIIKELDHREPWQSWSECEESIREIVERARTPE